MSTHIPENLGRGGTWIRGLYMLLFAVLFNVAEFVLAAVAVFQFLAQLLTGGVNRRLQTFGGNLAAYLQETTAFLTYASEERPFPIGPWPGSGDKAGSQPGPLGPGTEGSESSSGKGSSQGSGKSSGKGSGKGSGKSSSKGSGSKSQEAGESGSESGGT